LQRLSAHYMFVLQSNETQRIANMKKKFWIVNQVNATTAEILLYGFIGQYDEIDDAAFISELRQLEASYSTINIRVNCGGGDVYKGLAIFNAIRNSKANINGFIDGIAASMGAAICAAIKPPNLLMSKYARYMTHRATGFSGGNADDLRDFANELEQLEGTLASMFAQRTGLSVDDAKTKYITNQDRWISAEQALQEKLVDGIYDADPVTVPDNQNDPQQLFNAYHKIFNITSSKHQDMKALALLLGLPENATEEQIIAAMKLVIAAKETAEAAAKTAAKAKAKKLVDTAILNKQATESERADLEALAESNYDAAEKIINKLPKSVKPSDVISNKTVTVPGQEGNEEIKTWEDLVKKGDDFVKEFKKSDFAKYKSLYEAYYKISLPAAE
jgi:ATP-dependent Clp endopeptidase proteolytic subunit ClpP